MAGGQETSKQSKACVALCGAVIRLPPINAESGRVNDPSNYLKETDTEGEQYCCYSLLPRLPPTSSTSLSFFLIFIHFILLHGFTPLIRRNSSFIADGVSETRSVVRGVRVSSHEAVGLSTTANVQDETPFSYNISRDEIYEFMITVSLCASNKSCFDLTMPR